MRAFLATLLPLLLAPTLLPAQNGPYRTEDARADWQGVLDRYLIEGDVDYDRIRADDPPEFRRFLAWLESARPSRWSEAERRAFWINAYNARVIAGVLRYWPIDSVRDVGFLGGRVRGFFSRREHPVAGGDRTLEEIEAILTDPSLYDPRVHFALAGASRGGPRLRSEPYRVERLDTQLDFQTRTYLNGPEGHRLDRDRRVLYLTRVLEREREPIERRAGSIREFAAEYLTGEAATRATDSAWSIGFLDHDWRLNAVP